MSTPHQTPYTDKWKKRLREALRARGRKAELARFLAGGDPARQNMRAVRVAEVLNQGRMPECEFVLAVEAWLALPARKTRTDQTAPPRRKHSYE